jgi:hypothetical protein
MKRFISALMVTSIIPVIVWFGLHYDYSRLGWTFLFMLPGYFMTFIIYFREFLTSETPLQDLFLRAAIFNVIINLIVIHKFSWPIEDAILRLKIDNPRKDD